jgi:hypothetical protein
MKRQSSYLVKICVTGSILVSPVALDQFTSTSHFSMIPFESKVIAITVTSRGGS